MSKPSRCVVLRCYVVLIGYIALVPPGRDYTTAVIVSDVPSVVLDMVSQVIKLHPNANWFHIGADEVRQSFYLKLTAIFF